jgi:hypothetical protein
VGGAAYTQSLLEQSIETSVHIQNMLKKNEERYAHVIQGLRHMHDMMKGLHQQSTFFQQTLSQLSEGQEQFNRQAAQFLKNNTASQQSVTHLSNVEDLLKKLLLQTEEGQKGIRDDIKNESRLVARTISALGQNNEPK